ncbi:MAG: porin [Methylobacillus sp.]|nr:porin [Methylobacillus sp.]
MMFKFVYRPLVAALVLAVPASSALADEATDRIKQLEEMMHEMQQQRIEQDKQMQLMAEELKAMREQMPQAKEERDAQDKSKGDGSPVKASFKDGLIFTDDSGDWKMQINGRVQADYRDWDPSEWKTDSFTIRRARLGATFGFLQDFTVRVEGEYANDNTGARGSTALTYGYLDYTRWGGAKIRVGQFKPFFGLERTYSTNFTDFAELSLATNNGAIFTSTYDRGVMLFGDPLPWLNYNVYYVNGSGQNNDDVNDTKDFGGRVNANLARLADIKGAVIHIGASASAGSISFSTSTGSTVTQSTEGSGVQFFSVNNLLAAQNSDRDRWGLEGSLAYGPVKLSSEYIRANFQGTTSTNNKFDNDIKAWYVDMNWMLTGESWADTYKSGIYGRMKPKQNFDSKDGWGAFELGARYSKFDASDFESMLTLPTIANPNTYASEAHAWTLGAKWLLNPNARIVLNYVHSKFDDPILVSGKLDDVEKAIMLRAQYDF